VPVADAVYVDGPLKRKACTESALYARIARHKLRESPEVVGSKRKSPSESPVLDINNAVAGKSAALECLPGWIDKAATDMVLTKRRKRSTKETNRENFANIATTKFINTKYNEVFKLATLELDGYQNTPLKRGRPGYGASAVAKKWIPRGSN